jgi:hypothetical protein
MAVISKNASVQTGGRDLSEWDYSLSFTLPQAAALVVGLHPNASAAKGRSEPVLARMCDASIESALARHRGIESPSEGLLTSLVLDPNRDRVGLSKVAAEFASIVFMENPVVTRLEIVRWLKVIGLSSRYDFDLECTGSNSHQSDVDVDKPVGTRERDTLLAIIAVLCKEAKLDHTKHAKTAGLIQSMAARMTGIQFEEPPVKSVAGLETASGVLVVEADGRVWVVSPTNRFGGYTNTFPKGKIGTKSLISLRANAVKEVLEEAGLQVALSGFLCDSERSTSVTRYYIGRRIGGNPAAMEWESQAVHLVPVSMLAKFVSHPNDQNVIAALQANLQGAR